MDLAEALIVCRFVQFMALMLLFGASIFSSVLAPRQLGDRLRQVLYWPEITLAVLIVLTCLGWLALETGEIGDGWPDTIDPGTIGAVLTGTEFGTVWTLRLVLMLLPLLSFLFHARARGASLALSTGLLLASLGFVGHAADQTGWPGFAHRLNHALHLLSGGFWIGCLPPLLVTLALLRLPDLRGASVKALRRFSGWGHLAVAAVLLTGVVNTVFIVGGFPGDLAWPYQRLLVIKIGLVLAMVFIAVFNRYFAVPRLSRSPFALKAIAAGTIAEILLGTTAIALVSAFATFDPTPMAGG